MNRWDYKYNPTTYMRYDSDHKARTHKRIVKNAAREFRVRGLKGPGVATLMRASGLTVGGFYKHFRNRDHLLAEAIEEGLADFGERLFAATKHAPAGERWREMVKCYLSLEHCEHPDIGCPLAALAPEIARASPAVRKRILGIMKARRERVMQLLPGRNAAEKERNFNIIFTAMAGAVSLARTMSKRSEKLKVLDSVRDHLLTSF